jgi:threonine/homoserine/homoserine lactone efflux protein
MTLELLKFLSVSAVVIATPGQDTALTIRSTLAGGRRAGVATAFGVAVGQAFWTLAACIGVTALLRASAPAFAAVRMIGAGYLVLLGGRALRDAWRGHASTVADASERESLGAIAAFRQGLLSNLGNPKMAIFFTSLLPQFLPRDGATFASLLGLGVTFCSMTLAWLALYAAVVARLGDVLRRSGFRRGLDALLGAVLVAFGLRLASERR